MVDNYSSGFGAQNDRLTRRGMVCALAATAGVTLAGCVGGGDSSRAVGDVSGQFSRRYVVDVDGSERRFGVDVPRETYTSVRQQSRSFGSAVDAARDSAMLERVGRRIARTYDSNTDRFLAAQAVVTDIEYARDISSTGRREYIRYPTETVVEETGDCEDLAILLAGLLSSDALGFRTGFVIPEGHCAVLVDRADLPESLLVADPLTVTLSGREYVYVEAVEERSPGSWARDYGDRPLLVAYRGRWHPLDVSALTDHSLDALTSGEFGSTAQFFQ
jgi:hypothetical protein